MCVLAGIEATAWALALGVVEDPRSGLNGIRDSFEGDFKTFEDETCRTIGFVRRLLRAEAP
jgi:hypothetical protein